jgi:hypothetical protein
MAQPQAKAATKRRMAQPQAKEATKRRMAQPPAMEATRRRMAQPEQNDDDWGKWSAAGCKRKDCGL